jgi:hypothetical protein
MNDTINAFNINSSRRHIRGNQSHTFAVLEAFHCTVTLSLRKSSMQGFDSHAIKLHLISNSINPVTSSTKNDCSTTLSYDFRGN